MACLLVGSTIGQSQRQGLTKPAPGMTQSLTELGRILDSKAFINATAKLEKNGEARKAFEGAPAEWLANNGCNFPKGVTIKAQRRADLFDIIIIVGGAAARHNAELHIRLK